MAYSIEISNVDVTNKVIATTLNVEKLSDNRSNCFLSLKLTASEIGATDGMYIGQSLEVLEDGTNKFGGVIKNINVYRLRPKTGTDTLLQLNIYATGYNEIAARRVSTITRSNTTAGAIATDIVNDILNLSTANDNVGLGTIDTGASYETYSSGVKSVKEMFDDLAIASGFKWYIDENKNFNFVQEDTITDSAHKIEEGGTFVDYDILQLSVNLENYRNKQWIVGAIAIDGSEVAVSSEDSAEISSRASIEGASGVYGHVIKASGNQSESDALISADNGIKRYGRIPYTLVFESYTNDWNAGERLTVNLPTMGISTDTYFLIESVELEDVGTALKSTVTATRRKQSDFSTQHTEDFIDYFSDITRQTTVKETGKTFLITSVQNSEAIDSGNKVLDGIAVSMLPNTVVAFAVQITGTPSTTLTATINIRIDGVTQLYTKKYWQAEDGMSFVGQLPKQLEGSYTIDAELITSTGTLNIPAENYQLTLWINGGNAQETDAYPSASVSEVIDFSYIDTDFIDETVTTELT